MQASTINNSIEKFWSLTTTDAFNHVSSTGNGLSNNDAIWKAFQTGWFVESVIPAILIVLLPVRLYYLYWSFH